MCQVSTKSDVDVCGCLCFVFCVTMQYLGSWLSLCMFPFAYLTAIFSGKGKERNEYADLDITTS
jgi:hypothetical protein